MTHPIVCKIFNHFEEITDPLVNRGGNYSLAELMFLTLCASLADCDGWIDVERFGNANLEWLRKYLPFELGIPSHDTLGRVFSKLDPVHFYACLKSFSNGSSRGSGTGRLVRF